MPIIIDPGTFVYTPFPKNRNQYRSTSYHNTVCIKKSEQNRFINNNLFSLSYDVNNITNKIKQFDKDIFRYIGTHNGYKREGNDYVHEREFKIKNRIISISDKIVSKSNMIDCFATFLIPKKYFRKVIEREVISELINIQFNSNNITIIEGVYSANEYGELNEPLIKVKVNFEDSLKTRICIHE